MDAASLVLTAGPMVETSSAIDPDGMGINTWIWLVTLVALTGILIADLLIIGRKPHEPSMKEATWWAVFYIGLAAVFGLGVWFFSGAQYAGEFFAGFLTEKSLSVDNLFVFVIIMARFSVPRAYQQKVLFAGIVVALLTRGAFIAAGAALISHFVWVFYIFGAFLLYTAIKLLRHGQRTEEEYHENSFVRACRRFLPISTDFGGGHLMVRDAGKRLFTPMIIVMVAIGTTDVIFALDSIPAIFGLTKEAYIVFTTNVFALMGLRQLYFLLGGLLQRLKYLSYGLSFLLAFIGVKLIMEALHATVPSLQWVPDIPIWLSMSIIVAALIVTTLASVISTRIEVRRNGGGRSPGLGSSRRPKVLGPAEPLDASSKIVD